MGAIFGCPAHDQRDLDFAKAYNIEVIPVVKPKGFKGNDFAVEDNAYTADGTIINSEKLNGLKQKRQRKKLFQLLKKKKIGKSKTNYKLRDWGISRQRFWGCPIPIIYREDGEVKAVKEEDLPVKLPNVSEFK